MPQKRAAKPKASEQGAESVYARALSEMSRLLLLEESVRPNDERRDAQRPPPGDWTIWLAHCGRGWGKTYAGAHWVHDRVQQGYKQIALIGATAADARDVMILNPKAGLVATAPPGWEVRWEPSKRRVVWPEVGAIAHIYSAEEPERLRGPEHDSAWCDEIDAWGERASPKTSVDTWNNLMLGLRVGEMPKCIATSTPKPGRIVARILKRQRDIGDVVITSGSTMENEENLPQAFLNQIMSSYKGTRLYLQEVDGVLLEDVEGALWTRTILDKHRVKDPPTVKMVNGEIVHDCDRMVVAIDPAVTSNPQADETGILVAMRKGDFGYVLEDATARMSPRVWAQRAVSKYEQYMADVLVGEVNNGGELVKINIDQVHGAVNFRMVRASRGKAVRAEPISNLYEQGRIKHVGVFNALEDQLCNMTMAGYAGEGSPDRADALVWALSELFLRPSGSAALRLR